MIRAAQPEDAAPILRLISGILTSEFPKEELHYATGDLKELQVSYPPPRSIFLVAQEGDKIVGTIGVKADSARKAILRRLFVDPAFRRRGIGHQLLEGALQFCRQLGYREAVIRTSARMERAIQLCQSLHFTERGRWEMKGVTLILLGLKL